MFEMIDFQNFIDGFFTWLSGMSFWDAWFILLFTIVIDISRNIIKCGILVVSELNKKFKKIQTEKITDSKISIIVPAHNEGISIKRTIESILSNSYQNKEIIVVDDHSTDNTYENALPYYRKGLIKLIKKTTGTGSKSAAVNLGATYATGDILMIMDGDTLLGIAALDNVPNHLNQDDVIAISGNVRILSGDGGKKNLLTRCQSYEYLISLELGRRYNALMKMLLIIPGAFSAMKKDIGERIGLYDMGTLTEDFDLTLKLLKTGGKIDFIPNSIAWTYCPNNWKAWFRQRVRWTHGQLSGVIRHRDVLKNTHYRKRFSIALYDMIFMDIALLFLRMAGLVILVLTFSNNIFYVYFLVFILYLANEFIVISTAVALSPHKSDAKYMYLIPFIVFVYRPIYTYVRMYAYIKKALGKASSW